MKREYNEIMAYLTVTPEMRRRVLQRLQQEELPLPRQRPLRFPGLKKYLAAAACLVLLLAGAATLPRLLQPDIPAPPVQTIPDISQVDSAQALSDLVGFPVTEEFALPFTPVSVDYTSYWRELAQVQYNGEDRWATFRKSPGDQENSGDYTPYSATAQITVGGVSVTLKGEEGLYLLAVWSDGTFSYSLYLSQGASEEEWGRILQPSLAPR